MLNNHIKMTDLVCRTCVFSHQKPNGDIECRRAIETLGGEYWEYSLEGNTWCGQGIWVAQRPGYPRWTITRQNMFLVEEMDGQLVDPWET